LSLSAQTKADSILLIQQSGKLFDLDFTQAESDSMLSGLQFLHGAYQALHKTLPENSLAYPFAFLPASPGFKIPTEQQKITWNIPSGVSLPQNKKELAFYSIPQLASLIKNRKISSVELTKFFIDRIKKWDDTLHCIISLTEELALREAKTADDDLRKGKYHGLLHGIPYGLKDLFSVKGYKTTWGSMLYKDQVIEENSFVYTQLKKAGAVLCAKLSLGALGNNDLWFGGQTKNPWNLRQGSSGSSAGSAAATVAGLLPFAIGSETLGSIVSPSDRCGATGLRPTFGTISRSGAMVLCWSLDKVGPICRSAEDAAIVYYWLNGKDTNDAGAVEHAFNYHPKQDIKKLRMAYAENYFKELPKDALEWEVLKTYQAMGAILKPVQFPGSTVPPFDSTVHAYNMISLILAAESSASFDELVRTNRDDLVERQDKSIWPNVLRTARFIPAVEYINANRYRAALGKKIQEFMQDYDVVIVPTFADQISITNLTGNPVVCMPIGFTGENQPYSITLVGNLYDEASILEAAKAYQDNTDHNKKHPLIFYRD
jgi:Asp-tRNA(Asn)/Glu-tRNA(Gln) amidotransferase A subunit family amidase